MNLKMVKISKKILLTKFKHIFVYFTKKAKPRGIFLRRFCLSHIIHEILVFQNIHVSFLRTVPPYSHQANVWVEMLKQFKYRQLVFIHSSDTDGRALLGRFQTQTQDLETDDQEVKVQVVKIFHTRQSQ